MSMKTMTDSEQPDIQSRFTSIGAPGVACIRRCELTIQSAGFEKHPTTRPEIEAIQADGVIRKKECVV